MSDYTQVALMSSSLGAIEAAKNVTMRVYSAHCRTGAVATNCMISCVLIEMTKNNADINAKRSKVGMMFG